MANDLQDDVSAFVAQLVVTALHNATELHGGAVTRRALVQRSIEAGSTAGAVHNVIGVMLRTLRQGELMRATCAPMQFCIVLKASPIYFQENGNECSLGKSHSVATNGPDSFFSPS